MELVHTLDNLTDCWPLLAGITSSTMILRRLVTTFALACILPAQLQTAQASGAAGTTACPMRTSDCHALPHECLRRRIHRR